MQIHNVHHNTSGDFLSRSKEVLSAPHLQCFHGRPIARLSGSFGA